MMRSQIVQYTVMTNDAVVLPPNPDRRALLVTLVSTPGFGGYSVLVNFGAPATKGLGVLWGIGNSNPYGGIVPLNIHNVGEQIKQEVHMATTGGQAVVSILETFE